MLVRGHTATIHSSVIANIILIDEQFFCNRYRIVIVSCVTGALSSSPARSADRGPKAQGRGC